MLNLITMKKLTLIYLFLIMAIYGYSQASTMTAINNLSIAVQNANSTDNDSYIEGSPYSLNNSQDGKFYQKGGIVVKSQTKLNYYRNNFEFTLDDKTYLVNAVTIDSVIFGGKTYLFKEFEVKGSVVPRIVEVVDKGEKSSIYKFTEVELKPEVKASGYVEPKPATYSWNEPIYLVELGDKLISVTTFKKLTGLFPEKEAELKQFIKKNKLKKDDPNDLKKLLDYINKMG
jgi:hypothetical protein